MTEIVFNRQKNGYDTAQVDNYIKKIAEAYQSAYDEYAAMREKYDGLLSEHEKLKAGPALESDTEIIAKALLEAEKIKKDILEKARKQEAKIAELSAKTLESAHNALERSLEALGTEAQKFSNPDLFFERKGI
ncbi:MAG: DivIVA domain-containing protein [Oscillospiraceae bacterium]|nr:DivIVA domain-containing protein [Oscillospiraceae bacterium]